MATEIFMPKAGMDMQEGRLIRWLKNVGDKVEYDEPIMEIETDKITMESEAPASGILLSKLYDDDTTVPVLTVIGYIGEAGEAVPQAPEAAKQEATAPQAAKEAKASDAPQAPANATKKDSYDYDVAVIGGGPAGYVGAIKAAQLGAKVVIFEKDVVGGTCLNRGCIPTKTYLKTAEYLHHIRTASERGIQVSGEASVNMDQVVDYKNKVVHTLTSGVAALLRSNNAKLVKGEARMVSEHEIECAGKTYSVANVLLCGGSVAGRIPIEGIDHKCVMTSDDILDLREVPEQLCIIGAGVIGCEMACAFAAFGSKVTIVEMLDAPIANFDADICKAMRKSLEKQGITMLMGRKVSAVKDQGGKPVVCTDQEQIACDAVLLSIGRTADLSCLGALKDKVKTERGKVVVDEYMRTNLPGIYAAGDLNGRLMLAHAAFKMAEAAAANAMGHDEPCDLRYVPSCVYTIPEAASVGMTEQKAKEQLGQFVSVGKFPLSANGRSLASGEDGFIKVVIDNRFGELLGVHIFAADAAEMIAEPTALMASEVTVYEIADKIVHGHPSYSEAFMEACADALGRCIHLPKKK